MIKTGVLAIQGAFARHAATLSACGAEVRIVKYRRDLEGLDGLVLPGGESTTMTKMMGYRINYEDLFRFAEKNPVFGTCAGLILLGRGADDARVRQFALVDAEITRNAYGSQKESFVDDIPLEFDRDNAFHAIFIRAPRIQSLGNNVRVLASCGGFPVLIESELHLGATFHPELTDDRRIHQYFIQKIKEIKNGKKQST
ncbi:MAG: pyridoxal 5'-phosphate synthase glutaminase subunit PdxT [Candidatus Neomarinimicrobiota bacterium]|jgi:5'-phosphate synthase pdxT subunit|nr:pyridoxal 5'-phosphate synthase glutaminase subunit PdxT [Candidatus Neomarinimicrobiota bacterium]MDD3966428.1 pyridoxal 5'-phosphate synthase glutaminase subunit PdxT [Candidatus Neomarinimicrobiota bacterium]MDX9779800.1 pyridoxal 5'-phosphate synthase glutaminase subunit PdxT [bacterium]